jgi:hypothetical protein
MACGAHKERKKERKKDFNNNLIHVILGSAKL